MVSKQLLNDSIKITHVKLRAETRYENFAQSASSVSIIIIIHNNISNDGDKITNNYSN